MGNALRKEIEVRSRVTRKALEAIGYRSESALADEFSDCITGEMFSEDPTTLQNVPQSEYLMVHELSEISELKKLGRAIDKRVVADSPKTVVCKAHLKAMQSELGYAMPKRDSYWAKLRLRQQKEPVLVDDPNLSRSLRSKRKHYA